MKSTQYFINVVFEFPKSRYDFVNLYEYFYLNCDLYELIYLITLSSVILKIIWFNKSIIAYNGILHVSLMFFFLVVISSKKKIR